MSAAAAFQYHWPFGDELCVTYAMIMSTAGCAFLFNFIFNPNVMRINNNIGFVSFSYWPLIFWCYLKKKGIGSITTLTALALWRCQLVVYCPAKRSGAFANHHSSGSGGGSSAKLGRVQATILLTLIWTYSLAVTCPPLFGWGRYDREAAHIR